jgi:hypothetical protein
MDLAQGLILLGIVCVALVATKLVWELGRVICGIRINIDYIPI